MRKYSYSRAERIGQLIHQEISKILQSEIKDPRLEFITVVKTKVSADLRYADIFVSFYQTETGESFQVLKKATPYIRKELAKRIELRYVPQLRFKKDQSLEYDDHLAALFKRIGAGSNE